MYIYCCVTSWTENKHGHTIHVHLHVTFTHREKSELQCTTDANLLPTLVKLINMKANLQTCIMVYCTCTSMYCHTVT